MTIAIGTDHGGFHLKDRLIRQLKRSGHRVLDMGTDSADSCDYPEIGARVAQAVSRGRAKRGILLCKSGAGMAIVANKFPKVRAVVCESVRLAQHAREHNDANILVLGAQKIQPRTAQSILTVWLKTRFGEGRHGRRVRQIRAIEKKVQSCSTI